MSGKRITRKNAGKVTPKPATLKSPGAWQFTRHHKKKRSHKTIPGPISTERLKAIAANSQDERKSTSPPPDHDVIPSPMANTPDHTTSSDDDNILQSVLDDEHDMEHVDETERGMNIQISYKQALTLKPARLQALKAKQRENEELKQKLKDLESEKLKMQNLLAAQDDLVQSASVAATEARANYQVTPAPQLLSLEKEGEVPKFVEAFAAYTRTCTAQSTHMGHWTQSLRPEDLSILLRENPTLTITSSNQEFIKLLADDRLIKTETKSVAESLMAITTAAVTLEEFRTYSRKCQMVLRNKTEETRPSAQHLVMGFVDRCGNEELRRVLFQNKPATKGADTEKVHSEILNWMADTNQAVKNHFLKQQSKKALLEKLDQARKDYRKQTAHLADRVARANTSSTQKSGGRAANKRCQHCFTAGRTHVMHTHFTDSCGYAKRKREADNQMSARAAPAWQNHMAPQAQPSYQPRPMPYQVRQAVQHEYEWADHELAAAINSVHEHAPPDDTTAVPWPRQTLSGTRSRRFSSKQRKRAAARVARELAASAELPDTQNTTSKRVKHIAVRRVELIANEGDSEKPLILPALLDTGSDLNIMSDSVADKLIARGSQVYAEAIAAQAVNGSSLNCTRQVACMMTTLCNGLRVSIPITFCVFPDLPGHSLILSVHTLLDSGGVAFNLQDIDDADQKIHKQDEDLVEQHTGVSYYDYEKIDIAAHSAKIDTSSFTAERKRHMRRIGILPSSLFPQVNCLRLGQSLNPSSDIEYDEDVSFLWVNEVQRQESGREHGRSMPYQSEVTYELPALTEVEDPVKKEQIQRIIDKHREIFRVQLHKDGADSDLVNIELLADASLKKSYCARYSDTMKRIVDTEIAELLKQHVIEPSDTGFTSPLLLIPKPGRSTWRVVVDFKNLNRCIKQKSWPLPRPQTLIQQLAGKKWFCVSDLRQAYFQLKLHPKCRDLTAFNTGTSQFRFASLPQGLCNSPSVFQRAITLALGNLVETCCLLFLDDLVIWGNTWEEYLENVERVFACLAKKRFLLRADKTKFALKEITYLGYRISAEGYQPTEQYKQGLLDLPPPSDTKSLRQVLGLINFVKPWLRIVICVT